MEEKVLVLRTCRCDMKSFGGFIWPKEGPVECPDWLPRKACGNGLHGWLWGAGDYTLRHRDSKAKWLIVEVLRHEIIDLGHKVKFPRGDVLKTYDTWHEAMEYIARRIPDDIDFVKCIKQTEAVRRHHHTVSDCNFAFSVTTGDINRVATVGCSSNIVTLGFTSHACATGDTCFVSTHGSFAHACVLGHNSYAATANEGSNACAIGHNSTVITKGRHCKAVALGMYGTVEASGRNSLALAGLGGTAKAGEKGIISIHWFDGIRMRLVTGYVGEDGILPNVAYYVKDGKLVPVD